MQKTDFADAPFFEPKELRGTLTALHKAAKNDAAARQDVLAHLKEVVAREHKLVREQLEVDRNGPRCAKGLSDCKDELIRIIFDYATTHVYRATNPSDAENMAIVATGGYGRGLLAPGSDIDLLFLLPYKQTPWGESVVEFILYMLWDLGFKVGHATRNVDQCMKMAQSDMTIRTAMLDSRLILGEAALFDEMVQKFNKEILGPSKREYIDAKMEERDDRHARSGDARYRVEPNVKDGKGGLRDLHTLHWLSKSIYGSDVDETMIEAGVFTEEEVATFHRCEDFLWTVRCFLHFHAGRAEELLSFEYQPAMAEALGYKSHGGLRSVERFMKHYFLVAKDVGDMTTILCSALEMQQMKSAPKFNQLLNPMSWRLRRQVRTRTDFRIENDRINVSDVDAFKRDPVNLLRLFAEAAKTNAFLHPDVLRLVRRSLRLIDHQMRLDPTANKLFVDLLAHLEDPERTLRWMNEAGVLGRFIPEFQRVVGMTQFNMYHHFTVDDHLIRTVGMLKDIENGGAAAELPLSTKIFDTIAKRRRVLFVAAFLHDIGKGCEEDHSIVGARVAREVCPRLGMSGEETELVAWLIEEHLTMSNMAQNRDLTDPKTISDFAKVVKTKDRLKLLLLLTVADIRAVGPGTWNGWKGQLLRTLYHETMVVLGGERDEASRANRVARSQETLRRALADWDSGEIDRFIARFYPEYWLRMDTEKHVEHAGLIRRAEKAGDKLATDFTTDSFTAVTELTVYAPNHARLLSLFAGVCAAVGANIVGANVTTTCDGFALDSFLLQRELGNDDDEQRRVERIRETIHALLKGERRLKEMLESRRPAERRIEAFHVEPTVTIDNELSNTFTVIEVEGRDRPGLLYDLTTALSDLNLDISSAHITTFGEKAVDAFYVTDLTSKKIESGPRMTAIADRLVAELAEEDTIAEPASS